MTKKYKYDLSWGDPVEVRKALGEFYSINSMNENIIEYGYSNNYEGLESLISKTRDLLHKQTGIYYDHILITNGATHALNIVLRVEKKHGVYDKVAIRDLHFPHYPEIIQRSGFSEENILKYGDLNLPSNYNGLIIQDSPSNAWGNAEINNGSLESQIIWDSVYHNPSFINEDFLSISPPHFVNVGSYSKMLGLAGLRVGWIATQNGSLHTQYAKIARLDSLHVSMASQAIVNDILKNVDLDLFFNKARENIGINRDEFKKIEFLFGDFDRVPPFGMFYTAHADTNEINMLDELGITYTYMGRRRGKIAIRFNLTQDRKIVRGAIRKILEKSGKV